MILRTTHIPGTKPVAGERMTFEEFLEREFDHQYYEWVDGEAVEMPPIELKHAELREWVSVLLGMYVQTKAIGKVLGEPFLMKTGPTLPGRSPDLFFLSNARLGQLERLTLRGPADLVIEISSPSTCGVDRGRKFREYEAGGVGEYWLLDPLRKTAEFFVLEDGTFTPADVDEANCYSSRTFLGIQFEVDWFWSMPPAISILKKWSVL